MIPRAAALTLLVAVLGYLLSELGWRGRRLFTALGCVAILLLLSDGLGGIISEMQGICEIGGVTDTARTALKVVFSGYIFGFCSDTAAELGENGIANAACIAGRVEAVIIVLPYLSDVFHSVVEVL